MWILSRHVHGVNSMSLPARALLVAALVGSMFVSFVSTPPVGAATWNIQSQGDCARGPEGASWTTWNGFSSSDSAQTYGFLMYWNGSSWNTQATGYGSWQGSSGNAQANVTATYMAGTWFEEGQHYASFINPSPQYSYGNQFSC